MDRDQSPSTTNSNQGPQFRKVPTQKADKGVKRRGTVVDKKSKNFQEDSRSPD